jgi:release factor glutamine methyltransferase
MITYRALIKKAQSYLKDKTACEYLLEAIAGKKRHELYLENEPPSTAVIQKFSSLIKIYSTSMPIQYLVNKAYFLDYELYIDPRAMIPRPETEELILKTVDEIKNRAITPRTILDLGTGSGNIAIGLSNYFPKAKIIATDISPEALEVAKINIDKYHLNHRIFLINCDLFNFPKITPIFKTKNPKFDLIVSNPPYIPESELSTLAPQVKDYEPWIALNGGKDGFEIIERIINQAPRYLTSWGILALELDPRLKELILKKFRTLKVKWTKDLQGKIRYAFITY